MEQSDIRWQMSNMSTERSGEKIDLTQNEAVHSLPSSFFLRRVRHIQITMLKQKHFLFFTGSPWIGMKGQGVQRRKEFWKCESEKRQDWQYWSACICTPAIFIVHQADEHGRSSENTIKIDMRCAQTQFDPQEWQERKINIGIKNQKESDERTSSHEPPTWTCIVFCLCRLVA